MHACTFRRRQLWDCFDFIAVRSPTGAQVLIWKDRVLVGGASYLETYAEINSALAAADGYGDSAHGRDWHSIYLSTEQLTTLKIFAKLFGHITSTL